MILQDMYVIFVEIKVVGFSPSAHDHALFIHVSPHGCTLLPLYVDDDMLIM